MLTEVDQPLPPASRIGFSLRTVGVGAPLLYVGYISYLFHRTAGFTAAQDGILSRHIFYGYASLLAYGGLTALANGLLGRGLEREERRTVALGGLIGLAAAVIYFAANVVQWHDYTIHAVGGASRWLGHLKWPPFLLFAAAMALVYEQCFQASRGRAAKSQTPGLAALLAGLAYSINAGIQAYRLWSVAAVAGWRTSYAWTERLLSLYPVVYGLVIGGLMLAVACQLMDLQVNDPRERPTEMRPV